MNRGDFQNIGPSMATILLLAYFLEIIVIKSVIWLHTLAKTFFTLMLLEV